MARSQKIILSVFSVAGILIIAFWFGKFTTTIGLNLCYGRVIEFISTEALVSTKSKNPKRIEEFQNVVSSLPLHGYETECDNVESVISKYKAKKK